MSAVSESLTDEMRDEVRLMRPKFVHLRTHSAYSLLEGALPIKTLAQTALAARIPALAVTDRNNLFGALEFAETAAGKVSSQLSGLRCAFARLRTAQTIRI